MALAFEKYDAENQRLWDTMKIIRDATALQRVSDKIKQYQAIYQKVQDVTGVPWQMVAVIHLREAGEQDIGRWKGVLHNGELIVGTGRKTRLVPAGRGPFATWHEAAVHALKEKKFHTITSWTPAKMLSALEPYNGYGYRNKGLRSPYLWASTNHQQRGKYVRDGVFDGSVMDNQVGCAAQLKYLGVGETKKVSVPTVVKKTGFWAGVGGIVAASWQWGTSHPVLIGVSAVILFILWMWLRDRKQELADRTPKQVEETVNV